MLFVFIFIIKVQVREIYNLLYELNERGFYSMKSIFKNVKERKLIMANSYLAIADGLIKVADDLNKDDPKLLVYTYEACKYVSKALKLINFF